MPTSSNSAGESKQLDEDELASMSFMTSPSKRDPTLEISLLSTSTKLLTTDTSDLDEEPPFTPPVSGADAGIGSPELSELTRDISQQPRRMPSTPITIPVTLSMPSTPIALEQVDITSPAAEPTPIVLDHVGITSPAAEPTPIALEHIGTTSSAADPTPAISMLSAPPPSETTDQSLLDEQQPVMPLVHDIPVFQDDVGINPSFLQSEGSRDTLISMASILADVAMDDGDRPNDGGIAITPESPVVPQNDMEMRREAGVCNKEDEEQMPRQSPVDTTDDDVTMERQSLEAPDDVEMRDAFVDDDPEESDETPSSKFTWRNVPRHQENSAQLAQKKRKARSASRDRGVEGCVHSFKIHPIQEPETLKEFVRVLFHIFVLITDN